MSDTHGLYDPRLAQALHGSDVILHAGDVGSPEVLDQLRLIAPVHAVRGNVDGPNEGWPPSLTITLGGVTIHVVHILTAAQSDLSKWAHSTPTSAKLPMPAERLLCAFDPAVEVVIFGHSHSPCLFSMGGVMWVNPGSAGPRRFKLPRTCARLEITGNSIAASVRSLDGRTQGLPERIEVRRKEAAR
ncbi:MAG TPA: metallophosphoesterase family protein [Terriglobia bacterium]|nr:metallophosphoesterase family protein [Terriglobia bacterium]